MNDTDALGGDKVWRSAFSTIVRAKTKTEALRMIRAAGRYENSNGFSRYYDETDAPEYLAIVKQRGVYVRRVISREWTFIEPKVDAGKKGGEK